MNVGILTLDGMALQQTIRLSINLAGDGKPD